jgi:outer membrane protein TolC
MRRWIALLAVATLVAPLSLVPARAQDAQEGVKLSLADALRMALENNLNLVIARKDPKIAEFGIQAAEGAFDSALGASANYDSSKTDSTFTDATTGTSAPDNASQDNWDAAVSWGQRITFGAQYSLTASLSEQDPSAQISVDDTNGIVSRSDSLFKSRGLVFRYSMPLLRGFGREVNTADIVLARSDLDISRAQLELEAQNTMKTVEDAYWDLLAVRAALDVAKESLKLAQDLLDLNRKKVEVGTLAPIEITQAEAGVASREEGVIVAETAVKNAEDVLRRLLAVPNEDPSWDLPIQPTDKPTFDAREVSLPTSIETALARRAEIANARRVVEQRRLSERVAKDGTRHGLSFDATVGRSEPSQEFRSEVLSPPGIDPRATNVDITGTNWSVGLNYTLPIGNRTAKAGYEIAKLNLEKSEVALNDAEQAVRVDVRIAVRSVESGVKRVKAAQSSTVLQRKTLDAEQKKFDNGMSTSFEVLRIQTDLSNARVAEIRAILDYNKSLADLERAQGTLLEARGLKLE